MQVTCQSRFLVDHLCAAPEISKTPGQGHKPRIEPISPTFLHLCDQMMPTYETPETRMAFAMSRVTATGIDWGRPCCGSSDLDAKCSMIGSIHIGIPHG